MKNIHTTYQRLDRDHQTRKNLIADLDNYCSELEKRGPSMPNTAVAGLGLLLGAVATLGCYLKDYSQVWPSFALLTTIGAFAT